MRGDQGEIMKQIREGYYCFEGLGFDKHAKDERKKGFLCIKREDNSYI